MARPDKLSNVNRSGLVFFGTWTRPASVVTRGLSRQAKDCHHFPLIVSAVSTAVGINKLNNTRTLSFAKVFFDFAYFHTL